MSIRGNDYDVVISKRDHTRGPAIAVVTAESDVTIWEAIKSQLDNKWLVIMHQDGIWAFQWADVLCIEIRPSRWPSR